MNPSPRTGVPAPPRHASARSALVAGALVLAAAVATMAGSRGVPAGALVAEAQASRSTVPLAPASAGPAERPIGEFRITGSTTGLFPGSAAPLVLTVTNPNPFAIVVRSLAAAVGDAGAGCAGTNVSPSSYSGKLRVRAHGTAAVTLSLFMRANAPQACAGSVFPLSFSGWARRA